MDIWEKKYYACDCASEIILLSNDKKDKYINFAIFSYGKYYNDILSFKERLRYIWNILRTGKPYKDEIILNYSTAKELGKDLLKLTKEETMNINNFALEITEIEGGKVQVNIAQVKEILRIINDKTNGKFYELLREIQ